MAGGASRRAGGEIPPALFVVKNALVLIVAVCHIALAFNTTPDGHDIAYHCNSGD